MRVSFKLESVVKVVSQIIGLGLLALCANASAYDVGQHNSKREAVKKPVEKKVVDEPKYSPTQIVCLKQRREGSRIIQNKCQTIAKWKRDHEEKEMRKHLVRAKGASAVWETGP